MNYTAAKTCHGFYRSGFDFFQQVPAPMARREHRASSVAADAAPTASFRDDTA